MVLINIEISIPGIIHSSYFFIIFTAIIPCLFSIRSNCVSIGLSFTENGMLESTINMMFLFYFSFISCNFCFIWEVGLIWCIDTVSGAFSLWIGALSNSFFVSLSIFWLGSYFDLRISTSIFFIFYFFANHPLFNHLPVVGHVSFPVFCLFVCLLFFNLCFIVTISLMYPCLFFYSMKDTFCFSSQAPCTCCALYLKWSYVHIFLLPTLTRLSELSIHFKSMMTCLWFLISPWTLLLFIYLLCLFAISWTALCHMEVPRLGVQLEL